MPGPAIPEASAIGQQGRRVIRVRPTCDIGALVPGGGIVVTPISGLYEVGSFRITVASLVAAVFRVQVRDANGVLAPPTTFNNGTALVAGAVYSWSFPSTPYAEYQWSFDVATTILLFSVDELEADQ